MKPTTRHNGFSQPSYPLRKKRREKETNRKKREAEKRKEIDRKVGLKEHGVEQQKEEISWEGRKYCLF